VILNGFFTLAIPLKLACLRKLGVRTIQGVHKSRIGRIIKFVDKLKSWKSVAKSSGFPLYLGSVHLPTLSTLLVLFINAVDSFPSPVAF
jgi:hypothetical protein